MPLVEQELITLPEHPSSPPFFCGVCVTQSLALCVGFVDHCPFGHWVVCPSIYGFWFTLWYLQILLKKTYSAFYMTWNDSFFTSSMVSHAAICLCRLAMFLLSSISSSYVRQFSHRVRVMVFNTTFNNISVISWQTVLLVEETGVPAENHWQTLSHISGDWHWLHR